MISDWLIKLNSDVSDSALLQINTTQNMNSKWGTKKCIRGQSFEVHTNIHHISKLLHIQLDFGWSEGLFSYLVTWILRPSIVA